MEEKVVTINLRKKLIESSRWKRKPKLIRFLKHFFSKSREVKKIVIDKRLNDYIWKVENPGKIKVKVVKSSDGVIKLEKV